MNEQLADKFYDRLHEVLNQAKDLYGFPAQDARVQFYEKGKAAGKASKTGCGMYVIKVNLEALEKHFDGYLADVIPHEVAHLVCYFDRSLGRRHDAGWKRVCIALGGTGSRTHSWKLTPARVTRLFRYVSDNGRSVTLSSVRHNRLQRGKVNAYVFNLAGRVSRQHFVEEVSA